MSELELFDYSGHQVRTVVIDGEPWFVAADVARILGYRDAANLTRRLDPEDRGTRSVSTPSGTQAMTVINEPGFYVAVLASQVPGARQFKRWVTHEVLPQIRQTGKYAGQQQVEYQVPQTFAAALELAFLQAKEIEALEARQEADAPKVEAYERLMDADGYYSMETAGKAIGVGRNTLFRMLREDQVLQYGSNLPYQRYMHHFVVTTSTWTDRADQPHVAHTTRVRPAGLDWLSRRYGSARPAKAITDGGAA